MIPRGLSDQAAAQRLQQNGYNELPSGKRRTVLHILLEVVREPMFGLLLGAGVIYLILGDRDDALMLLAFVLVSMTITVLQERKTERVLETLRDLSSPRALVIRGGEQVRIPGREVVVGDILILEEGDRIAADGDLLTANDLQIDESLMTGESIPVWKRVCVAPVTGPTATTAQASRDQDADASGRVISGSMIVQGGGMALVTATGAATQIGRIGKALHDQDTERSPLQAEIGILVKRFAVLGISLSLLVLVLYGWSRSDWLGGLLAGITLAMTMLPEEFMLVLTVFMALGAWRLSASRVLTRRTPVIETLGSATVLCVDKTGTLTENRMTVKAVMVQQQVHEVTQGERLPEAVLEVLDYAVLASEVVPFDPMEKAFHFCAAQVAPAPMERGDWHIAHDYPLTSECMAMTHAWKVPGKTDYVVATKGAPEAIARLCRLSAAETSAMLEAVQQLASSGLRVLGVARATHEGSNWPAGPDGFAFHWLGLVALNDPVRAAVPPAVNACHQAGIRVVMITGDYPVTAQAIARDAGLASDHVVTGAELAALSPDEVRRVVAATDVFARILPEQKLLLVNALKADGQIVAMTGDGVNDAPALKAAHIGISMGKRGTDVAREASSLVLLDDDFNAIVDAVRIGRRINDNLRKAMIYIVAVHIPIAGMALLPLLFGAPLAFMPVHIAFLEMIINPTCSIVFEGEAEERDIMQRPPRKPNQPLFGRMNLLTAGAYGIGLLAAAAAVFFLGLLFGLSDAQARAATFACLVVGNLSLIVASRSATRSMLQLLTLPNRAQWWVFAGALAALGAALFLPAMQRLFHFSEVGTGALAAAVAAGIAVIAWFELIKLAKRRQWLPMFLTP